MLASKGMVCSVTMIELQKSSTITMPVVLGVGWMKGDIVLPPSE